MIQKLLNINTKMENGRKLKIVQSIHILSLTNKLILQNLEREKMIMMLL